MKKPIYKIWWFWVGVILIIIIIGTVAGVQGDNTKTDETTQITSAATEYINTTEEEPITTAIPETTAEETTVNITEEAVVITEVITEAPTEAVYVEPEPAVVQDNNITFTLNNSTMIFHTKSTCPAANKIKADNRDSKTCTVDEIKALCYSACGICSKIYK